MKRRFRIDPQLVAAHRARATGRAEPPVTTRRPGLGIAAESFVADLAATPATPSPVAPVAASGTVPAGLRASYRTAAPGPAAPAAGASLPRFGAPVRAPAPAADAVAARAWPDPEPALDRFEDDAAFDAPLMTDREMRPWPRVDEQPHLPSALLFGAPAAAVHMGSAHPGEAPPTPFRHREAAVPERAADAATAPMPVLRAAAAPAARPAVAPPAAPPRIVWSELVPRAPRMPPPPAARVAPALAVPAEKLRPHGQPDRAEPPARPSRRAGGRARDAAPSRLSYRMHRMWLTPIYRSLFWVGVPAFASVFAIGLFLSDADRREALLGTGTDALRAIQERPEFMVNLMAISGASPELGEEIRTVLPVNFPVSSFDLDLESLRQEIVAMDAVAAADLRVKPGGILEVRIDERSPALLWRGDQGLVLLDATGHRVSRMDSRLERPDLPIIAGDGADKAVPEALKLIEVAQPVAPRLRGLVRMGERRWDVVLDNGQRILLPEQGAVEALQRVMALAIAEDMLSRDVTVVDMRFGDRPTLRLAPGALEELRRGQTYLTGASSR